MNVSICSQKGHEMFIHMSRYSTREMANLNINGWELATPAPPREYTTHAHRRCITLAHRTYWHSAFTVMSRHHYNHYHKCVERCSEKGTIKHTHVMHRTNARAAIHRGEKLKGKNEKEEKETTTAASSISSSSVVKEQKYPLSPSHIYARCTFNTLTHSHTYRLSCVARYTKFIGRWIFNAKLVVGSTHSSHKVLKCSLWFFSVFRSNE